jgi:hypothetical protein
MLEPSQLSSSLFLFLACPVYVTMCLSRTRLGGRLTKFGDVYSEQDGRWEVSCVTRATTALRPLYAVFVSSALFELVSFSNHHRFTTAWSAISEKTQ